MAGSGTKIKKQDRPAIGSLRPDGQIVALTLMIVVVVATALSVAYVAQLSRHLFNRLEADRRTESQLQARYSRLLLERGALASHSRIERIARQQLDMRVPKPDDIVVVKSQ